MRNWLFRRSLFLQNIPIQVKLLITPIVMVVSLALVSGLAVYGLIKQSEALKRVDEITLNRITLIDQFTLLSEQVQSNVYRVSVLRLMEASEDEIQTIFYDLESGVIELGIYYGEIENTWVLDEKEKAFIAKMKVPMDEFILLAQQATKSVSKNPSFGALLVRSSDQAFREFRKPLEDLREYQQNEIERTQLESLKTASLLKSAIYILMIVTALLGILGAIIISNRFIARPILETTRIMSMLAENDLSIELHGLDRSDEIGAMRRAVEVFRNNAIEKEKLAKALKENEDRLLMAQAIAHVGNWELDLKSQTMWASEEAFRIYGLERTSPSLTLKQAQQVPLEEDRPRLDAALEALLHENIPYDIEFRIQRKHDAVPRVLHSKGHLLSAENGTPSKVVGVIQDITERKQAEAALRQSEEKFSKAFHTTSYAITLTRAENGEFLEVNDAFTKISGYTREEAFANSSIGLKLWLNEVDRQQVVDSLRAGQPVIQQEYLFRRKDGEIITGLFSAQAIQLNQQPCIISSINDITQRKRAEQQVQSFSAELERSNKELEQFAYIASHDLQEPLRMVISFLGLLEKRTKNKLDQDALEYINFAVDGAQRMKSLVSGLLDFSRVGTQAKPFAATDLEKVIDSVLNNLHVLIKETQTKIMHNALPSVMADEIQLVSLFQNLIGNSIKFHSDNPPEIIIHSEEKGNDWIFSIQDNGIGIDPGQSDRIFNIFQRLNPSDKYPGSGIGLAISKRIVERHGGRIWVESTPGEGSVFFFTLPKGVN